MQKQYIKEEDLLNDSFKLGVQIFESGFRPNFIVGLWRGGSTIGIYVQECLQYLGVETDHISVRTSYRGMDDYIKNLDSTEAIRVHGLQYLLEEMNHEDSLLIVDDVFSTGRNIESLINRLQSKTKNNMPKEVRIATLFNKPEKNRTGRTPDYCIHETEDWLVLPYELTGLTDAELKENKNWIMPILKESKLSG
jgi:hypoxanthine phosphoribosyltransferase